jgi:hypothetical protein
MHPGAEAYYRENGQWPELNRLLTDFEPKAPLLQWRMKVSDKIKLQIQARDNRMRSFLIFIG